MNMKEKESRLTAYITILSASLIVLLLLLSAFWYLTTGDSKQIEVKNGILDMESWDFEMDEPVSLTGQWEFYWKQFLTVSEMADAEDAILAEVPGTWDEYSLDGQGLPGQGYGTYRLHVKTGLVPGKIMGFRIQTFSSAYRLYVDDRLLAENGNASGISYEE